MDCFYALHVLFWSENMEIGNFFVTVKELAFFLNVAAFILFGLDKLMAKKKKYRIPEFILLFVAVFLGGVGAMFGMVVFNHKTSKALFRFLVPAGAIFNYFLFKNSFSLLRQFLEFMLEIIPK